MLRFHSHPVCTSALLYSGHAMPSQLSAVPTIIVGGLLPKRSRIDPTSKEPFVPIPGINYLPISSPPSCQAKGLVPRYLCSRGILIPNVLAANLNASPFPNFKGCPFDSTEHFSQSATFRGCVCCLTFIVARTNDRTGGQAAAEEEVDSTDRQRPTPFTD